MSPVVLFFSFSFILIHLLSIEIAQKFSPIRSLNSYSWNRHILRISRRAEVLLLNYDHMVILHLKNLITKSFLEYIDDLVDTLLNVRRVHSINSDSWF